MEYHMHKIIIIILALLIIGCGKLNKLSSSTVSGSNSYDTYSTTINQFLGNYDLIEKGAFDCGASIQILQECDGFKLLSNSSAPEDYCNINKGEVRFKTVTFQNNEIKSISHLHNNFGPKDSHDRRLILPPPRISNDLINSLVLNKDGTLIKSIAITNRISRCTYLKR
jgi:hypothetical protein